VKKKLRTRVIDWSCTATNWLHDHCRYPDNTAPIGWRDHLRWFLEGRLNWLFAVAYDGSAEEIEDGIEFAQMDVDPKYLTDRQLEVRARLVEWVDLEEAE
jgi:hypothetical protein